MVKKEIISMLWKEKSPIWSRCVDCLQYTKRYYHIGPEGQLYEMMGYVFYPMWKLQLKYRDVESIPICADCMDKRFKDGKPESRIDSVDEAFDSVPDEVYDIMEEML